MYLKRKIHESKTFKRFDFQKGSKDILFSNAPENISKNVDLLTYLADFTKSLGFGKFFISVFITEVVFPSMGHIPVAFYNDRAKIFIRVTDNNFRMVLKPVQCKYLVR